MLRISRFQMFLIPLLAVTIAASGCGDDKGKDKDKKADAGKKSSDDKGAAQAPAAGEKTALTGTGVGTLKGKIMYDGDPPARKDLADQMKMHADKDHCTKEDPKNDTKDQTWMVGADKGVQNVVVWVRAPKDKYFQLSDEQKKRTDTVGIDQPFCMFEPRVVVVYPSYFDGKKQVPTGQQFKALNSAPIGHSTRWAGDNKAVNAGQNLSIQAKSELPIDAKPAMANRSGEDRLEIKCDKHGWMQGFAWVFDNPFHAVTKPDGTFEIKGVPAGTELEVVYWHESMGMKPKVEKITIKDGDNDFSKKIK